MLVYTVKWDAVSSLTKGKGRVKTKDSSICFTVLCRKSTDAVACLYWVFDNMYVNPLKLSIDDGLISIHRTIIDSRHFDFTYLLMDKMSKPLKMSNVKDSINTY